MCVNVPDFLSIRVREDLVLMKSLMGESRGHISKKQMSNCKIILYGNELSPQDTTQQRTFFYSCWRCVKAEVQTLPKKKSGFGGGLCYFSFCLYLTQPEIHALQNWCLYSALISELQTNSSTHSCVHQTGICLECTTQLQGNLSFPPVLYFRL